MRAKCYWLVTENQSGQNEERTDRKGETNKREKNKGRHDGHLCCAREKMIDITLKHFFNVRNLSNIKINYSDGVNKDNDIKFDLIINILCGQSRNK